MPRTPRIEFENAWYHIMNRGAGRKTIFPDEVFRVEFIQLLAQINQEFQLKTHAYCLMDNHFHLLVQTPHRNLNLAMQKLTSTYSRRHNKLKKTDGPLFKGRYKSIVIAEEAYLAQVGRYIHRNPVEAGITQRAQDYQWSSLYHYCYPSSEHDWLLSKTLIDKTSPTGKLAEYLDFVENPLLPSMNDFYNSPRLPGILAGKAIRQLISAQSGYHTKWFPRERVSLNQITKTIFLNLGISELDVLSSGRGKVNIPKALTMHIAQTVGRYTVAEIANYLNLQASTVTQSLTRFRRNELKHMEQIVNQIRSAVSCA